MLTGMSLAASKVKAAIATPYEARLETEVRRQAQITLPTKVASNPSKSNGRKACW